MSQVEGPELEGSELARLRAELRDRERAQGELARRTAELREANAFLSAIVENIPHMIFVKDARELRFVRLNRAGEELLGFPRGELVGKGDADFFTPEEAASFTAKDREVLASGQLRDIPEEPIHAARGLRWLHTKKVPIIDEESGKPHYLLGISEDITLRKTRDRALRCLLEIASLATGEAFFRQLTRQVAAALEVRYAFVAELRPGGQARTIALWDAERGEALADLDYALAGAPCEHVIEQGRALVPAAVQARYPGFPWLREVGAEAYLGIALRASGGRKLGALGVVHTAPLDEGAEALLRIFADRAAAELERVHAEAERAATERTYQDLLESAPDPVVICDARGRVRLLNGAAERTFGVAREEVLGRSCDVLVPGMAWRCQEEASGDGLRRVESTGVRADGSHFPVELSLGRIRSGEEQLVSAAIRDVTERKRAEVAKSLLEEIHHRIKNNLQVVQSLLELQARRHDDPRLTAALEESSARVRSMALIHERLYRDGPTGGLRFDGFLTHLIPILRRTYAVESPVEVSLHAEPVSLSLDACVPCGLIVHELVANALMHAFPCGRPGRLEVELVREGEGRARLEVADDGVGLPQGLDFRATQTLGLRLVSGLTDQIGGAVELAPEPTGTRFVLRFPVEPTPAEGA
ncbi:MAG: PAS domain S-box protein [Planctomycetota bacterium]